MHTQIHQAVQASITGTGRDTGTDGIEPPAGIVPLTDKPVPSVPSVPSTTAKPVETLATSRADGLQCELHHGETEMIFHDNTYWTYRTSNWWDEVRGVPLLEAEATIYVREVLMGHNGYEARYEVHKTDESWELQSRSLPEWKPVTELDTNDYTRTADDTAMAMSVRMLSDLMNAEHEAQDRLEAAREDEAESDEAEHEAEVRPGYGERHEAAHGYRELWDTECFVESTGTTADGYTGFRATGYNLYKDGKRLPVRPEVHYTKIEVREVFATNVETGTEHSMGFEWTASIYYVNGDDTQLPDTSGNWHHESVQTDIQSALEIAVRHTLDEFYGNR